MQDSELLRAYVSAKSEVAFDELVKRYMNLVHSAARRQVGDDQIAREVSQEVFCLLVKKAAALTDRASLAGWLYQTTLYTAARTMRAEWRRRSREKDAAIMNEPETQESRIWLQLEPLLDEGLKQLNETDRLAVLLRFFQNQSTSELASVLGVSEPAAKMRVTRALEKLRIFFGKRGVACSSVVIASLLSQRAVQAAPEVLAGRHILNLASQSVSFSPLEMAVLTMNTKTKIAAICGLAGLLIGGAIVVRPLIVPKTEPLADQSASDSNIPVTRTELLRGLKSPSDPQRELDRLLYHLKIALHNTPDANQHVYPPNEVTDVILRFPASQHEAVFRSLKEAAADANPEVRYRAISAMKMLGADTPGMVPFLWDTLKTAAGSKESSMTAQLALNSLQFGGSTNFVNPPGLLTSADTHSLLEVMSSLQGNSAQTIANNSVYRQIAGVIAQFVENDAEGKCLSQVEKYLDDPNPNLRLEIACILAKREAGSNPRILDELIVGLQNADQTLSVRALGTLESLGSEAKPVLEDLLSFADNATGDLKTIALQAVGKIEPDLRQPGSEVDLALTARETEERWKQAYESKTLSLQELQTSLAEPSHSSQAAIRLGEMGSAAVTAVPNMIDALDFNVVNRDLIMQEIYRIDPNACIEQFDSSVMDEAFKKVAASDTLTPDEFGVFNSLTLKTGDQWTKGEIVKFSNQLAASNEPAWRLFINNLTTTYPDLAATLRMRSSRH
jgi:RNA polymerase sigma factor (sigma-70 family)